MWQLCGSSYVSKRQQEREEREFEKQAKKKNRAREAADIVVTNQPTSPTEAKVTITGTGRSYTLNNSTYFSQSPDDCIKSRRWLRDIMWKDEEKAESDIPTAEGPNTPPDSDNPVNTAILEKIKDFTLNPEADVFTPNHLTSESGSDSGDDGRSAEEDWNPCEDLHRPVRRLPVARMCHWKQPVMNAIYEMCLTLLLAGTCLRDVELHAKEVIVKKARLWRRCFGISDLLDPMRETTTIAGVGLAFPPFLALAAIQLFLWKKELVDEDKLPPPFRAIELAPFAQLFGWEQEHKKFCTRYNKKLQGDAKDMQKYWGRCIEAWSSCRRDFYNMSNILDEVIIVSEFYLSRRDVFKNNQDRLAISLGLEHNP